jgi:nucleotide-binding universal stress UspA family protein
MATKRILVAVDGSDGSRHAVERAIELAGATKAALIVLEVIEDFGPLPGIYEAPPAGVDRVQWVADQRFAKVADLLDAVAHERVIEEGYVPETICSVAARENADLIVIGSRGLNAAGRALVGSVSDRVVHHAPCAVLVVR